MTTDVHNTAPPDGDLSEPGIAVPQSEPAPAQAPDADEDPEGEVVDLAAEVVDLSAGDLTALLHVLDRYRVVTVPLGGGGPFTATPARRPAGKPWPPVVALLCTRAHIAAGATVLLDLTYRDRDDTDPATADGRDWTADQRDLSMLDLVSRAVRHETDEHDWPEPS